MDQKVKGPAEKNLYEVVYPLGESLVKVQPLAPRLDTLEGKTICELAVEAWKGELVFSRLKELLPARYSNIKMVPYPEFGYTHTTKEKEVIDALPAKLSEHGCDAVISVLGS